MNAIEFVKKYGVEHAKIHVENMEAVQIGNNHQEYIDSLKEIVEAFELVDKCGGLNEAIEATGSYYIKPSDWEDLNKAIKLVEQCQ